MQDHAPSAAPEVQPMSFTDKLTSIFIAPGELFENVRLTGKTPSNWIVPMVIFLVIAIALSQLMLSNPSLSDQLGATIRRGFDQNVQQGRMTQEQADQTYEQFAKPGSTMFTIGQIGGLIVVTPIALFVLSLVYWLIGKSIMRATSPYMKVVEVIGLTFFISTLEQIVTTLMMYVMDSLYASPSLALFVSGFDIQNKLHLALSKINVFTFWDLSVVSIGLSKLFQKDLPKVLVLVFALWILWVVFTILTGFMTGR